MKPKFAFAIAAGLVFVLALISLVFNQNLQQFLPQNVSKAILGIIVAISGAMTFLVLLNDTLDAVEKLFGKVGFSINKYDVYISNSHTDQPFVEAVVDKLRVNGLRVWLTEQQLRAGQPIEKELSTAMKKAKSAVFFIGTRGLTNWQEKELNWAVSNNVNIIPVLLPGINFSVLSSFSSLRDRYTIQFSSPNDTQSFDNLLRGIKG